MLTGPPGGRRFTTTRWSMVLTAADRGSPGSQGALATLCEAYWHPVYAFVRRAGHNYEDARDLTQAFFARILETDFLSEARPDRGRFRSFLFTSLRNFLSNEYDWRRAMKRGGQHQHLSLEFDAEEEHYRLEPVDELTPEVLYERRWAAGVMEIAMQRLVARHEKSARRTLFERLRPFLIDGSVVPSTELASELGMSGGALRVALHRLRRQYAALLRETVAETVTRWEDVDDELRHLLAIVAASSPTSSNYRTR